MAYLECKCLAIKNRMKERLRKAGRGCDGLARLASMQIKQDRARQVSVLVGDVESDVGQSICIRSPYANDR